MDAQHPNVPFPNLEDSRFKNFWTTFLQRPDGKTCDMTVSTKPRIGRISPPLLHISGVSNDFTSASGQWKLCETLDPEIRQQQRDLVGKLLADDHSTLLRSAEAAHLTPEYKIPHLDLRQELFKLAFLNDRRPAFEVPWLYPATSATLEVICIDCNCMDDSSASVPLILEQATQSPPPYDHPDHGVDERKPRECNRAVTFDTFVEEHQLVYGDQREKRVRSKTHRGLLQSLLSSHCSRHRDQLMNCIKKRLETQSQKEKRMIAEEDAERTRQRLENAVHYYEHMDATS
jgi:hypothetical protein